MSKLQIPFLIWLLRTLFLSIAYCVTFFQQVQPAAVTDPIEVIALKSLAQKWSTDLKTSNSNTWKTPWNLTGDPCTGRAIDSTDILDQSMNPAFKCDCTFNNGNTCHITQLKVYAMDITGQIPPELANLTQIWDLNFGQNYLTGSIPAFLGNLTKMKYLSLGINNLSGPVPKELGNLRSLISLSFSSNNLNGSLPPELGSLTALEQM
eukprot:PITA_24115